MAAAVSSISTTLFDKNDNKPSISRKWLIFYFNRRVLLLSTVTGIDTRFFMRWPAWHFILVDNDKKKQFREVIQGGRLDVADFGCILQSGWGETMPARFSEPVKESGKWFPLRFHVIVKEIGSYKYYFYVLSDSNNRGFSKSEPILPQVKASCKLLHAGWGAEVPEAVADVFLNAILENNFKSDWTECDNCIYSSARNGEVDKIKSSGRNLVDTKDSNGWTFLHHAAYGGSIDLIEFLLVKNADVHKPDKLCGRKPVHIACREGHIDIVKLFLLQGMDVNDRDHNGWTLLHYASWNGNINMVQFLVKEKSANLNAQDLFDKKKPLHVAAREGHTKLVDFFYTEGMDIEDKDDEKRTPLYYAVVGGHFDTLKFLVNKGASVHCRSYRQVGTLSIACRNNDPDMLEYLLKKRCDIEARDEKNWTPLHVAAGKDAFDCVNYLCKLGANISALTGSMETPLGIAKINNSTDIIDFLSAKEAEKICAKENYTEALQIYRKLFNIQNKKLGNSHPDTLDTRSRIASLHSKLEEHSEALQIHTDVYNKRKHTFKTSNPDTLMSHYNMGSAMESLFRYTDAGSIYEAVYVKRLELLGADHPCTLQVRHDLASIYAKQNRSDVALHIFQDVYHRRKDTLGANHLDTLKSCQEVGVLLANTGELTLAVQHFKEVFEKRKEVLGPGHTDTSLAERHVMVWSEKLSRSQKLKEHSDSESGNWLYKSLKNLNLL